MMLLLIRWVCLIYTCWQIWDLSWAHWFNVLILKVRIHQVIFLWIINFILDKSIRISHTCWSCLYWLFPWYTWNSSTSRKWMIYWVATKQNLILIVKIQTVHTSIYRPWLCSQIKEIRVYNISSCTVCSHLFLYFRYIFKISPNSTTSSSTAYLPWFSILVRNQIILVDTHWPWLLSISTVISLLIVHVLILSVCT